MTTLHLETEIARVAARRLSQDGQALSAELRALRNALGVLDESWQGGGQEEFDADASDLLRSLDAQSEAILYLTARLQREIQEWEETDQRGAAALHGVRSAATYYAGLGLPFAGGAAGSSSLWQSILPMFTAVSITSFLSGLPTWLDSLLECFFPPPTLISPIPEGADEVQPGELSRLIEREFSEQPPAVPGNQSQEAAPATPSAQVAPPSSPAAGYDVYYDIQPKSQGTLYGNAACLPTSMSMVMEYYHSKNSVNSTASPSDLLDMLDPGDGTRGNGVGLDKLNDDLAELGYSSDVRTGSMDDLNAALREGPVIVNTRVGLIKTSVRDITPNGSVNHALLVKAINANTILVNDPWGGAEKTFSRKTFEQIWKGGGNYMVIVRPQGSAP